MGFTTPITTPSAINASLDPQAAIRKAARETGADFNYLLKTAQRESGMNPEAKASTSSATGLFQFTEDTWLRMINRYGDSYGLSDQAQAISIAGGKPEIVDGYSRSDILALRKDPVIAAQMAGELANENATILENKIGREPSSQELYIAHFLGPSGAGQLINAVKTDGTQTASDMFPHAARANPTIFRNLDGSHRSVADVYANLTKSSSPSMKNDASAHIVEQAKQAIIPVVAPSASSNAGIHLTSSVVMALLDLQGRHFENAENQQTQNKNLKNSSDT